MTPRETGKITQQEMVEMFGEEMPPEAVELAWSAGSDKTIGEIRAELRLRAREKKAATPLEIVADAMRSAGEVGFMPWDLLPEVAREQYLEAARAAIAAIPVDEGEVEVVCRQFSEGMGDLPHAINLEGEPMWTEYRCEAKSAIEALKRHILEQK